MRKILFRGKSSNKEWIFGDLIQLGNIKFITSDMGYNQKVDTETVGQFTGLCDKNGNKIFEGDIIKDENGFVDYVTFNDGVFYGGNEELRYLYCEIIGNIYDDIGLL